MSVKEKRQQKIKELIQSTPVETQEELAALLTDNGFSVTQATVSRDIKEMRLTKMLLPGGRYRYAPVERESEAVQQRFIRMFVHCVTGVTSTGSLVIIKTLAGSASAAAEALDSLKWPEIVGTIAGDNTVFVAVAEGVPSTEIAARFEGLRQE